MQAMRCAVQSDSHEQLLYFTSSSLSGGDDWLYTISRRTGDYNIFATNLATGEARRLTRNEQGTLRSYVYFWGTPRRGLGLASVSLDHERGMVYYIQDEDLCRVSLDGETAVLARIPQDQVTAFTHVSADGKYLCVPTTDARALEYDVCSGNRPDYDIDRRVQEEGLSSYLRVYRTDTGELMRCEKVPLAWITHVQFSPLDSSLILYNHEWPCFDAGSRRMWLWDGKEHRRLRPDGPGRSGSDWVCHEMWSGDGACIIYHGTYANGISFVGRYDLCSGMTREMPFPAEYGKYGHFTVSSSGLLVTDGYYQEPGEGGEAARHIALLDTDWDRELRWIPLCRHDSSWATQDAHPHPIFNHRGDRVYFTSDLSGTRCVYEVQVP